jgi:hypothetical protein
MSPEPLLPEPLLPEPVPHRYMAAQVGALAMQSR